jgi:hypothetical protein
MSTSSLFSFSQLAEASYADFWNEGTNKVITNKDDVIAALITENFSAIQANEFTEHWQARVGRNNQRALRRIEGT